MGPQMGAQFCTCINRYIKIGPIKHIVVDQEVAAQKFTCEVPHFHGGKIVLLIQKKHFHIYRGSHLKINKFPTTLDALNSTKDYSMLLNPRAGIQL
jgi:hypothetical protein